MITCTVGPQPRGTATQEPSSFQVSSANLTTAWGASPGSARVNYVREVVTLESIRTSGVAVGAWVDLNLTVTSNHFYGICKSDLLSESSGGKERTLVVHDPREFLKWDQVAGAWNMVENVTVTVAGVAQRKRRYWHILPANWLMQTRTYSDTPYTAAQILAFILAAPSVLSAWFIDPHPDQALYPVFNVDCLTPRRLDTVFTELADRQGLTFAFTGLTAGGAYILKWRRKGTLLSGETFPVDGSGFAIFPSGSDECQDGTSLTENPWRVTVVGDRNVWQLLNVTLTPDWAAAWQTWLDEAAFVRWVYHHCTDSAGTVFASRVDAGDPDRIVSWQLATARAQEITVREVAAVAGASYLDGGKYAGRNRGDMPALLYLRTLVWRAFRLPSTVNVGGASVASASVRVVDQQLVSVTHNPTTGVLAADPDEPVDGVGYAIARGYNLGAAFFERLTPAQFKATEWLSGQDLWGTVGFQYDQGADDQRIWIFDEPMIRSSDLVETVDGWVVCKARPTFTVPTVKVSVTVEVDRFVREFNASSTGPVQSVSENGLHEEWVFDTIAPTSSSNPVGIPYADGLTASAKAGSLASGVIALQPTVRTGGFQRALRSGDVLYALNGMVDRVGLQFSSGGLLEVVDFTNERGRNAFEPVRDYERRMASRDLFPGQAELKAAARTARVLASGMQQDGVFRRRVSAAFYGLGESAPLSLTRVASGSGTLPVGTPLWKAPSEVSSGALTETLAKAPDSVTSEDAVFVGVTAREGEPADHPLRVHPGGRVLSRVMGPITVGDAVGQSVGHDYLVGGGAPAVGRARQSIATAIVQLIEVDLGQGAGGSGSGVTVMYL